MDALTIRGLQKRFGDREVLRDVSLTVPEHSVFGFIGKNGAGKTTTMKLVLGLLEADAGEILVAGERVRYGAAATNRYLGYLPDVPEFYPMMTCREYLTLCGRISGIERGQLKRRTEELLELVGLDGETHRIRGFSRGMKQRLGIAQALLSRPRLLICDEPTSALDPVGRKEILDILLAVREQTTVLFSTHLLTDVERICTDVAILQDGAVAVQGDLAALRGAHGSPKYVVEVTHPADAERIQAAFPACVRAGETRLELPGEAEDVFPVLRFVTEQRITLIRLERREPTLESLFLEVVGE